MWSTVSNQTLISIQHERQLRISSSPLCLFRITLQYVNADLSKPHLPETNVKHKLLVSFTCLECSEMQWNAQSFHPPPPLPFLITVQLSAGGLKYLRSSYCHEMWTRPIHKAACLAQSKTAPHDDGFKYHTAGDTGKYFLLVPPESIWSREIKKSILLCKFAWYLYKVSSPPLYLIFHHSCCTTDISCLDDMQL